MSGDGGGLDGAEAFPLVWRSQKSIFFANKKDDYGLIFRQKISRHFPNATLGIAYLAGTVAGGQGGLAR
jgi:hypothetical protein